MTDSVWRTVLAAKGGNGSRIHGFDHWARVERNGLYLAERTGARRKVVSLFALFHDIGRENDGTDPEHGRRGVEYARTIRHRLTMVTDEEFDLLAYACTHHTEKRAHDDPTVAACWDADRLDLGRVGFRLNIRFFNTEPARELVWEGKVHLLERKKVRGNIP